MAEHRQGAGACCSKSSKKSGQQFMGICRSWSPIGVADNPPLLQLYDGGLTVAEGVEAAQALDDAGVAILDLSAGICGSRPIGVTGEAYFRPFAEAVSAVVRCHVVCTGGITRPQTAQEIVQSGAADLVGVGRAIAADHDWVHKAREETGRQAV